ncbi:MAG: 1-deoxy-D-xylulose-5-phosphate synthase [Treponema sp.]|jgi:1-deoxy-D-xylulose-5-phosphate synthase|nr:1-deoxy-D-xylulose-5-phosphate synthase [Treponema sp.]
MFKDDPILAKIHSPSDLSQFSYAELAQLAEEMRDEIVSTVSRNGGHLSSNLGVVELTIALHRVFQSPKDSIVWDVGHQCYAHKLLTGRAEQFSTLRKSGGISGFPKRDESPHDAFNTGHASTSISAALGLLAGERLKGGDGKAVAVIGDGALTGGMAFEALSHAGQLDLPLIIILNDNNMSISPNVGGLSKYLSRISMKSRYQQVRRWIDHCVKRIPFFGDELFSAMMRMKRAIKAIFYVDNFFVDLGFEYVGPIEGHQISRLEQVLHDVRDLGKPVVVHVLTQKGKGYEAAEHDPSSFHGVSSFSVSDGLLDRNTASSFTEAFSESIVQLAEKDARITAITAAMEKGTGLSSFKKAFPERFFDVGIAEEHAVTFAAGLAAKGIKPIVSIYSTFIQRAADQIIHDVALQNLPVVFALDRAGIVPEDGETHQGLYDIALFRSVPHMNMLAPAGKSELQSMLQWAIDQSNPSIIRYPKTACPADDPSFSVPIETGRGVFVRKSNASLCIAFTGSLYQEVIEARGILAESGIDADLYNLRFIKPIDENYLISILHQYDYFAVVEEGIMQGGMGEYIISLKNKISDCAEIVHIAITDKITPLGTRAELLHQCKLDGEGISQQIIAIPGITEQIKRMPEMTHDSRIKTLAAL